jgi:hypothetical protein
MTKIFIDCEFNGFGGGLLSFAAVSEDGREWYNELRQPAIWDKWVFENVFPHLGLTPMPKDEFRKSLFAFLRQFPDPVIIADWYTDLMHFFRLFEGRDHTDSESFACRTEIRLIDGYESKVPHHALHDARAIRDVLMGFRS